MAELNALLSKIESKEVQDVLEKYEVSREVNPLVKKLRDNNLASLKKAERKSSGDEGLNSAMKGVRAVTYDTEDALDNFLVEAANTGIRRTLSNPLGKPKRSIPQKFIEALKKMEARIDQLFNKDVPEASTVGESETALPAPVRIHADDYGDDDVDVIGFLEELRDENPKGLSVVSIIGEAGMGKTTLARIGYNKKEVKSHFDIRIWIAVSPNYELLDLLKMIAIQLHKVPPSYDVSVKRLGELICGSLQGKRFLLVLDNLPSTGDLWSKLKPSLPDEEKGCRVLITTKSLPPSLKEDPTCKQHNLGPLNREQSQRLLLKTSLLNKESENNFADISTKLAENCQGIPLALVLLGGVLSTVQQNCDAWAEVLETVKKLPVEDSGFPSSSKEKNPTLQKILPTCYNKLSFTLKSCFLYFAAFPENYYEIKAKSLIRTWVAEGFIQKEENHETTEKTAYRFLEDLVQRRMIQVSRRSIQDGAIISFHIHDLLCDFAVAKAQEENFVTVCSPSQSQESQVSKPARRLAVHHSICNESMNDKSTPNLRSVLYFVPIDKTFPSYKFLKVLGGMRKTTREGFEDGSSLELGDQLRYCELGPLEMGPLEMKIIIQQFTSEMKYLQTLDLRRLQNHGDLPDSIWFVKALRHVMLSGYTSGPPSEANLSDLQTLTGVKTRESWESKLPTVNEIRELDMKLDGVFPWEQIATFLAKLKKLISLRLCGTDDFPLIIIDMKSFPFHERLQSLYLLGDTPFSFEVGMLPTNLADLTLDYFLLRQDPVPVLEKLQKLKRLCLMNAFEITEMHCSEGGFCMLEELQLFWLGKLKKWVIEDGAMPQLKELGVTNCRSLRIPGELKYLRNLQTLNLEGVRGKEGEIRDNCKDVASISLTDVVVEEILLNVAPVHAKDTSDEKDEILLRRTN